MQKRLHFTFRETICDSDQFCVHLINQLISILPFVASKMFLWKLVRKNQRAEIMLQFQDSAQIEKIPQQLM